jgi:beta-galactosidase
MTAGFLKTGALGCGWLMSFALACASAATALAHEDRVLLDFGWQFTKGDASGQPPMGGGAARSAAAGSRNVDLPHDFSIEGPWSQNSPAGMSGGYAALGRGTYRRTFRIPEYWAGKHIYVEFDGVFNEAEVFIDGKASGRNRYGYLGFEVDATPWLLGADGKLKTDQDHVIMVRVDNSKQASRWYTGGGIYDHVWLRAVDPVHVPARGTHITTPEVNETFARVRIETTVRNASGEARAGALTTRLVGPDGRQAGEPVTTKVAVPAHGETTVAQTITVLSPQLWDLDTPRLYQAVSRVSGDADKGETAADYTAAFGIRTITWDPTRGFLLNGRRVTLKGVNLHHDQGALGAAAYEAGYERRLRILKNSGINAVRLAHNPHSPRMLDLCDRLGVLVFDEAFDKWSHFQPDGTGWRDDLARFIRRDRNHPSVIVWSVGNEMSEYQNVEYGATIVAPMVDLVHSLDATRPLTASLERTRPGQGRDRTPWMPLAPLTRHLDVLSLNYQTVYYDRDHERYPDKVLIGGEVNNQLTKLEPAETVNPWFRTRDPETGRYYPYVAGQFIWAGWDYLGEAGPWPLKGNNGNLIDTTGTRRALSYYVESLYTDEPMLQLVAGVDSPERVTGWQAAFVAPPLELHWNWATATGPVNVVAYTNAPVVELFLNDRSLGVRQLNQSPERRLTWSVPFEPGVLRAEARSTDGRIVARSELKTAGAPARLILEPDRTQLAANGQDLAFVFARVVDANGTVVPTDSVLVRFGIDGAGTIAGVDNGDLRDPAPFQADERTTRKGQALVIVKTGRQSGALRLQATAEGMAPASVTLQTAEREGPPILP